ncbi:MAG: aspartate aminotransferase family protein [Methyloceanibacter sp.]|nr:aspartate aminotransferase family protein [Methyloceanibacter sp.]
MNDTALKPDATLLWQKSDREHHLHPFTNHAALAEKGVRVITHADGAYIWDAAGNRFLDGMAGLWSVAVGYGREELVRAAETQLRKLPYYNCFFQSAHPPVIELAQTLARLTPAPLDYAFFANSGSEANDTVVKMVRYYWDVCGKPEKKTIISRKYAFHGSTLAASSLSGLPSMYSRINLPLPLFEHVEAPYWYDSDGALSPAAFGVEAGQSLERKILELGADKVAAFIGEPIQGAGGVIVPPETYWPEIQRICAKYDILLIADEVICGFGRTGAWFGSDRYGIKPDVMTLAKGLSSGYIPIAAVMVGGRVADVLTTMSDDFAHGYTYGGHPVACAVALENIRIIEEEGLVETVAKVTGPYLQSRLAELASHPLVGEVRGAGLIAGIELVEDKALRKRFDPERKAGAICRDFCLENGLIMRAIRDIMVLSPPLIITTAQIDFIVETARSALDRTADALAKGGPR